MNKEYLQALYTLKGGKPSLILALYLYNNGYALCDELATNLRMRKASFDKSLDVLIDAGLAERRISDIGEMFCCISNKYYDISECDKCERQTVRKININGKQYKRKKCKRVKCVYHNDFDNFHKVKLLVSLTELHGLHLKRYKNISKTSDLIKLFRRLYKDYTHTQAVPKTFDLAGSLKTLVVLCGTGKDKYQIATGYITNHFERLQGGNFSFGKFMNVDNIKAFVSGSSGKKPKKTGAELCCKHNVLCNHCRGAKCELEEQGMMCDDSIVQYMRGKYG